MKAYVTSRFKKDVIARTFRWSLKKYILEDVEERELTKKIKNLPKEIQKDIHIRNKVFLSQRL